MADKKRLTEKQRKFAHVYIEEGNAAEAYRQAYSTKNMSDEAVRVEASRLLKNPNVSLLLDQLREGHREKHNVTIGQITEELEEARGEAIKNKQAGAAVSASMGKAKIHGLIVEKKEDVTPLKLDEQRSKITDRVLRRALERNPGFIAELWPCRESDKLVAMIEAGKIQTSEILSKEPDNHTTH